jgi:hypothetical protein
LNPAVRQLLIGPRGLRGTFDAPSGSSSPKIVVLSATDDLFVITPKRAGTSAVLCEMVRGVVTSTDSLGGNQQFWRRTNTRNALGAWIRKKTASAFSGVWTTGTVSLPDHHPNATGGTQLDYSTSSTNGDYREFEITIGSGGKFSLGFLKSGTSTTSCTVSIPADGGFTPQVISTRRSGGTNEIGEVEFTYQPGACTVRVAHTGTGGQPLYILGANFRSILSANAFDPGTSGYDSWGYVRDNNHYNNGSGANDYAIFSKTDQKWGGSFHGGETATNAPVMRMDGQNVALVAGVPIIGRKFEIEQATAIQWSREALRTNSLTTFDVDGVVRLDAEFNGSVICETFVAGMSTSYATAPAGSFTGGFSDVVSPISASYATESRNALPIATRYVQSNPATGQQIVLSVTQFASYADSEYKGPHVWAAVAGPYFKPYNSPIQGFTEGRMVRQAKFSFAAEFI